MCETKPRKKNRKNVEGGKEKRKKKPNPQC
jgi:hypothetical protein